ncbi:hypothetical protein [Nucisporomicrobium flavum]|uniref:hypothetical protein n=1 Tax=Nucisporomicrobium flavum TaxID=2785915 RepID=UPI0018F56106|nr:hypothetical protein [Nucisporomicrobium flavum]
MTDHPCHQHLTGQHTTGCMTGSCGFCGTDLSTTASGECRSCLRIVCESCDAGYDAELGPICQPCHDGDIATANTAPPYGPREQHRRCVFELDLSCGHVVTYAVTGWYPVSVSCCDRLGGTILRGEYVAFASEVDYVRLLSERYIDCPAGTAHRPSRVLRRRARTDASSKPSYQGHRTSTGRYPARVGATWTLGESAPRPT